ncbi:MAG TPA: purine-nucleoside phosphorylase [Meiothermus sp.]|nr:purine-nucleoside phosphorylase [Meiothermus sp.]
MTPLHVRGQPGDVAPYVLLPGDPGRAQWIAENFLENPRPYTTYRSLLGFTGTYRGLAVSVQTTGMGCPSTAIVVEELAQLGAKVLVRVGTCGVFSDALKAPELVVVQASIPLDGTTRQYLGGKPYAPIPDYGVLEHLVGAARRQNYPHHVGMIVTEDAFYSPLEHHGQAMAPFGALAVEMESSALFLVAKMRGMKAGTVLAVVNKVGDTQFVAPELIQEGVNRMTTVALETFLQMGSP